MPGQRKKVELRFPFLGVNGAAPLSAMPEGSCPDMVNLFPSARTGQVSARRMIGAKRPGLEHAADLTSTSSYAAGVGIRLWETLYKPTSTTTAPITMLVMFDSSAGVSISIVTNNTPATFAARFNVPGTDAVSMLRPQYAQLGTKLFILGPNKTNGSNAGKACGMYLNSLQNVNAVPTSGTEWVVETAVPGADLCCTYRASVVIASSRETLFKVSAVGDGTNFTPTGDPDGAYVGNSAGAAGIPGDGIVALVPFGDEWLLFGCVSSIEILSGDPRSGGRVSNVTKRVGFFNKHCWCFDQRGDLWFIGSDLGLYRMPRGTKEITEVWKGRADYLVRDVMATSGRTLYLEFAVGLNMVLVGITTSTPGATLSLDSVAYHPEIDAIYPFRFGAGSQFSSHNCAVATDWGDVFFGFYLNVITGNPSPVRKMSLASTTYTDAADATGLTPINFLCRLRFAPIEPGDVEWTATKLMATGSQGTGAASWYWLKAASADEIERITYTSGYAASGTFFTTSGFQQPVGLRQTAAAHQLAIDQTSTSDLRLENFVVEFESSGIQRYGV